MEFIGGESPERILIPPDYIEDYVDGNNSVRASIYQPHRCGSIGRWSSIAEYLRAADVGS
jgi:hypothetical protein